MVATPDQVARLEADHETWRIGLFEPYLTAPTGEIIPSAVFHAELWDWVWALEPGVRPTAFVGLWFRRAAKSTNAEMATVAAGARRVRRYAWYLSDTQDQADEHVANIATMLTSDRVATFYPGLAERKLSKFGQSEGWRRNRVRTAQGFTVDALGLDTARRGVKIDDQRPDLLVIDDVDDQSDGPRTVRAKISAITSRILPAGANDLAVVFIQNLVHPDSIASRLAGLADEPADFLLDRIVSGPIPALEDLAFEQDPAGTFTITSGRPAWVGFTVQDAQQELNTIGVSSFLHEFQHDVEPPAGGLFSRLDLVGLRVPPEQVPPLVRAVCWVDPAITDTDQSDSCAIQIDAVATDGRLYRLWSWEQRATPVEAIRTALIAAARHGCEAVGIETDAGGDTWDSVFREARRDLVGSDSNAYELIAAAETAGITVEQMTARIRAMKFRSAKAGRMKATKTERAAQMLGEYERPGMMIRHVLGTHRLLEQALNRFPLSKPFDLVDAAYWAWFDLRHGHELAAANPADTGSRVGDMDADQAIRAAYAAERRSRWQ